MPSSFSSAVLHLLKSMYVNISQLHGFHTPCIVPELRRLCPRKAASSGPRNSTKTAVMPKVMEITLAVGRPVVSVGWKMGVGVGEGWNDMAGAD